MAPRKQAQAKATQRKSRHPRPRLALRTSASKPSGTAPAASSSPSAPTMTAGSRPVVPPDVPEFFLPRRGPLAVGALSFIRPSLWSGQAPTTPTRRQVWTTGRRWVLRLIEKRCGRHLEGCEGLRRQHSRAPKTPEPAATFARAPWRSVRARCHAEWTKTWRICLYRDWKLTDDLVLPQSESLFAAS